MSEFIGLLQAARDGSRLSVEQTGDLVRGIQDGRMTDAQLGAFAMAVCYRGMPVDGQVALTLAMRDSGQVLGWEGLDGPVVDKHSTGGVGDMVSLILGPLLAECGAYVPMISGRGLGHTGGTLDKLESIPGFQAFPALEKFQSMVRQAGVAIVGQTGELAPADGRLYAIRDETSTIPSVPLIVSSILSKKFAEGLDGLVLDVKTGNGAFMREREEARRLARRLVEVSTMAGLPCTALITDMSQPLAWTAGNALEVQEVIEFVGGRRRHPRLAEVTLALGAAALQRVGLAAGETEALTICREALESGRVAERFGRMVCAQGGPPDLLENPGQHLRSAPVIRPVTAPHSGWIAAYDTRAVGMVVNHLGGGRRQLGDKIDPRVGLSALGSIGDRIETGAPLAWVHAADEEGWNRAARRLVEAIVIDPERPSEVACILEKIDWNES
jgi:thymidine phosphorylase